MYLIFTDVGEKTQHFMWQTHKLYTHASVLSEKYLRTEKYLMFTQKSRDRAK